MRPVYTADDLAASGFEAERDLGQPGEYPFTRGVYPTMYRGRLWTMRQYAGMATAEETNERFRYLLDQGQTGISVAFDLPTQMGLDSDHPRAEGEVGKTGVAIDSVDDMARLLRRHPARPGVDVDDDQRDGADPAAALRAGGRGAGRRRLGDQRHRAERHPQGVRRARHVHLPARAVDATDHRPVRLLRRARAAVEHDLDQRLPHARGRLDRRAGDRVHARRRHRLRAGCARRGTRRSTSSRRACRSSSPATCTSSRRSRSSAPPGACGRASCASGSARQGPQELDAALPHADRRRDAHGAAAGGQHRAYRPRGPRRGARRHAVAAHELLRRGARAAHRAQRHDRAAHAAGHRLRDRRHRDGRPARGLVLRRVAHRRPRAARHRVHRQDRRDGRRGARDRGRASTRTRSTRRRSASSRAWSRGSGSWWV